MSTSPIPASPLSSASGYRDDRGGWVLGGGIEAALAANWTAKLD
ncbi:opacity protein-like surface antigen [Bradyrhizobium sp. USDA 4354]